MEYSINPPPNSGKWTTGICGCFEDCGNCCITGAALWTIIQILTGCGCIYTCGYRRRLRDKYGLPESPCPDLLTDCCCQPCSICQISRELKNRNVDPWRGYEGVKHIYEQPYNTKAPNQQHMTN